MASVTATWTLTTSRQRVDHEQGRGTPIRRADTLPQQPVVEVPLRTEAGAGPGEQGEKRENTGSIRPMNNAGRPDSAAVERSGTCTTGC